MSDLSKSIQRDADRAVAGARRKPCNGLPANPSNDHRVAFALGDVRRAAENAARLGATDEELEDAVCVSVPRV